MIQSLLNINSFIDYKVYSHDGIPLSLANLSKLIPPSLASIELSRQQYIQLPQSILSSLANFRPTPLFRAKAFEKTLGHDHKIYIKDEGATPTGNHKSNSAICIIGWCKSDGIKTITTETTGNWGLALARAAQQSGIKVVCFMDTISHQLRPDRKKAIEAAGSEVVLVAAGQKCNDLLSLSADAAIERTKAIPDAAYIFGSVYGYFLIPQSMIGLEAMQQLREESDYPDIVIGSCGGGANLMGLAAPFLAESITGGRQIIVFSAEAHECPILTQGIFGIHGIDENGFFPRLATLGITGIDHGRYIGGLGSTIVATSVANFLERGMIHAACFSGSAAQDASSQFFAAEGRRVALETSYQLAALVSIARSTRGKTFLLAISSVPASAAI